MLIGLGHDVKLLAPEAVRPFVKKGKKNDAADTAALCELAITHIFPCRIKDLLAILEVVFFRAELFERPYVV